MSKPLSLKHGTIGELFVGFSRCDFDRGPELDERGRLTRTFRTLELGAKEQAGKRLVVTRKMLEEMAANFAWRKSRGYKTPAVKGHPGCGEKDPAKAWEKRIEAPAVGWAQDVEVRDDGLYVTVVFNPEFSKQLVEGGYEFNSPSFTEAWTDEFGKARGAALIDVGVLNYPLQEGLGSIMAASALAGGNTMDPETTKLLEDILSRIEALEKSAGGGEMGSKLDEMGNRLGALEEAMKAPPADGEGDEEKKAELSALSDEVRNLTAKLNDDVVKLREQVEESTKRTQEAADKAHAAECLRFLSGQIDKGNLLPAELLKDWEKKPAEAFDALPFKSLAAAEKHFEGRENTVANLSAQQSREGATGDHSISDELWNASTMRPELIERFDGDEAKARAHYAKQCGVMTSDSESDVED